MGSRNPEKEMLKNHVALETYMKLAEAAIKSSKSSSKKLLQALRELNQTLFCSFGFDNLIDHVKVNFNKNFS